MRKISTLIIGVLTALGLGVAVLTPLPVGAAASDEVQKGVCEAGGGTWASGKCTGGNADTDTNDLNDTIHTVINVMLFIVGILAVIMIVYSGIRYVMSRGESGEVKGAKDTLMYSIVGLVVAIIAFAIVQWVFTQLG